MKNEASRSFSELLGCIVLCIEEYERGRFPTVWDVRTLDGASFLGSGRF